METANNIEGFEANITTLRLLIENYTEGLKWFTEHEKVKREWIEELTKLNAHVSGGRNPSSRKFSRLDIELKSSQLNSIEKKAHRSELLSQIEAVTNRIISLYPEVAGAVKRGDADLARFKENLKQLKVIFYKTKLTCFDNEEAKEVKTAIWFYLEGRRAKN